jgi:chaperonin GroEL
MSDKLVKHLNFGKDAKDQIFKGIEKLTKAVSSTLGASGKCVILEDDQGKPIITKDGVTVANSIVLFDAVENMGATLLKEAARKTVEEAGDGTTTATVLANAILKHASEEKNIYINTRELKEGINSAVKKVVNYLEKISIPVEGNMIDQVATISANNDQKLGKLIGGAFKDVGKTGMVIMEESKDLESSVKIIDGMQYDQPLKSLHFVTDQTKGTAELKNPLVLIVESKIENIRKIQGVLEYVIKNNKPLFIIADVEPQVLAALAMNKMKGNIKVCIVDAPTYGFTKKEKLNDIALMTGATVINEDLGDDMDLIHHEHLGKAKKITSTKDNTIIQVDEIPLEVEDLIKDLKLKQEKEKLPGLKMAYEKRLALLAAKVAVVKVGANSEIELKEKSDRVEDAICATRAAIKEGIVPGGGIALLNAALNIKESNAGEKVLSKAILSPFKTILDNAGYKEYTIPADEGHGIDVVTGNMVNMIDSGIIDPLLVTKSALINAASVATTILSTDCVINNIRLHEGNR